MRRIICAILAALLLTGCACAEGTGTEAWQHEAGWINFSVAITQEGTAEVWDNAAKAFTEKQGLPIAMSGEQLKAGILQGHALENDIEDLSVDGNRMTGKKADGTELFSYEYVLVELIEEEAILDGQKVYVFKTEEAGAGKYTYLLLTEPVKAEDEEASYTTFNLVCTGQDNYRALFDTKKTGTAVAICDMIEKDTTAEGLEFAIEKLFEIR